MKPVIFIADGNRMACAVSDPMAEYLASYCYEFRHK